MSNSNKTIAINTIVVYMRIFITMLVGLFSSRFVLKALGESDFGLYTVVGGIISMFSFLSGALSQTTTRYINYENARPKGNVNEIFNISLIIHIVFVAIIIIISEILGIYYINNYLVVDKLKIIDALFVFQTSLIITCLGVVSVPFQSLFIAKEKFIYIAIVEILQTIVRFGFILTMFLYDGNKLRYYAVIMSLTILIGCIIYVVESRRRWPKITKFKFYKDKEKYKQILYFNNYSLLGAGALVSRSQGSMMIVNYFYGTVVNAAYAIANNVQSYVNLFIGNFDTASGPQITQLVSCGNIEDSLRLVSRTCRICILLMCLIYFPLSVELEFILKLWLGNVPEGTTILCRYTLGIAIVSSTSGGLSKLIAAFGKIKWFQIIYSALYFSCLPISMFMLKYGTPVYIVPILFIISDLINRIIQYVLLNKYIHFDVIKFCIETYSKPIIVFSIMYFYELIYAKLGIIVEMNKFIGILITGILSILVSYFIGLKKCERNLLTNYVSNKLNLVIFHND